MSIKIRRSAGSFSPLESWLDRAGIKRRDPARDVADYGDGQPFKVFCMNWTLGQVRRRKVGAAEITVPRGGWLHIAHGTEAVWHSSPARETVVIPAQAALTPSDRQLHFRNQAAFTIVTPSGSHDIAIRKIDEDLVRLALVTAVTA
ncbi:hypothetical protein [Actinoplanes subglobosus]|uniref:Uncharacterized protein n=1 Tax=Actinoplanes subglobosus TaxID=1547892 RepID=A0ABV8J3L9_9ACTN